MIKNVILFVVDGMGQCLLKQGVFKGHSNMTDVVKVIAPLPEMSCGVNFKLYNATQTDYNQFMTLNGEKGMDNIPESDDLYQRVYDWNVWEIEVKENVLMDITFYRSGKVGISFKWRTFAPSANCVTYRGVFGASHDVPVGLQAGDWWYCDGNYVFTEIEFGDKTIMYYDGTNYHMDTYEETLPTHRFDVPIDPNFSVQAFTASEQLELSEIKDDILALQLQIGSLTTEGGLRILYYEGATPSGVTENDLLVEIEGE